MGLISHGLTGAPTVMLLAAVLGHSFTRLAREIRLAAVVWRALRGTRPDERPEILRAIAGGPTKAVVATPAVPELDTNNDSVGK